MPVGEFLLSGDIHYSINYYKDTAAQSQGGRRFKDISAQPHEARRFKENYH